jgi:O-antigen/teichoic acid export membrane protein
LGSFAVIAAQRVARVVAVVPAAAILVPDSFAALIVALAVGDISRSALHGFDVSLLRELSAGRSRTEVLGPHLGGKVLLGAVIALGLIVFAWVAYGETTGLLTAVSLAGLMPANLGGLIAVERQAALRLASVAPYAVGTSLLGLLLAVTGTILFREPLATVAGLALGDLGFFVAVWAITGRPMPVFTGSVQLLRRIPALTVTQLGYVGQGRIGVILLGFAGPPVAIAEFGIASRVAEGLIVFAVALTASSYPLMARALAAGELAVALSLLRRSSEVGLAVAAGLLSLLGLTAPFWLSALFPRYPDAVIPFAFMSVAIVMYFASTQTTAFLNAAHRDRAAAASSVFGFAVAAAGTVLLLPLGTVGAASGRIAGEAARLAAELVACVRLVPGAASAIVPSVAVAVAVVVLGAVAGLSGGIWTVAGLLALAAAALIVALRRSRPGIAW